MVFAVISDDKLHTLWPQVVNGLVSKTAGQELNREAEAVSLAYGNRLATLFQRWFSSSCRLTSAKVHNAHNVTRQLPIDVPPKAGSVFPPSGNAGSQTATNLTADHWAAGPGAAN